MGLWLLILMLPLAAWSGWWVSMRKEARDLRQSKSRAAYFEGISYLLNDQTDRAVDVFISMADVDQQTIDNQLTLGRLFRKRGELDRALHMHQQLMKYDKLSVTQRQSVQLELALDYDQAGMVAQAQQLLEGLVAENYQLKSAIPTLLRIYERTNQWEKVIDLAEYWQNSGYGNLGQKIAHYYCELAVLALKGEETDKVNTLLDTALANDRDCARVNWMLGEYYLKQQQYVSAIHAFQSIVNQSIVLLPEVLPMIEIAYQALERHDEYIDWLTALEDQHCKVRLTLACAKVLEQADQVERAVKLLFNRINEQANPLLFSAYLQYCTIEDSEQASIQSSLSDSIAPKTIYQCNECGFRQQRLIWHCPACWAWGSFQPVIELKIEQR